MRLQSVLRQLIGVEGDRLDATTAEDAGGGGGICVLGCAECTSRPKHPASDAGVTESSWLRCLGRGRGSRFTRAYEDEVAWLATQSSKLAVVRYMGLSWRSVGRVITRVVTEARAARPPLVGLRQIGIDETSYRKGHRYLTVVVDHATGRLVWAAEGARGAVLAQFFEELGPSACSQIELVTLDAAPWIASTMSRYCPNAIQCLDPFHVVRWAVDAVEKCRRDLWQGARYWGVKGDVKEYRNLQWILRTNQERLADADAKRLAQLPKLNAPLYRAYLLKEQLRQVFQTAGEDGIALLDDWLVWARRCQIEPMVKVAKTVAQHRAAIDATLRHRVSNARIEAFNGRFQLINRRAYGFHSAAAAIALAFLCLGGLCPQLPGFR